jgi:hypothetical protein
MPRRKLQGRLFAIAALFLLSACGGTASPTAPTSSSVTAPGTPTVPTTVTPVPTTPAANQWQAVLIISIAAEEFLLNNILGTDFFLDGTLEQRRSYSPAVFSSDLTAFKFLSPGRHMITARITNQVRTPMRYELTGFAQFARGVESISFECPRQRQSLSNGGEMTCTFTLP